MAPPIGLKRDLPQPRQIRQAQDRLKDGGLAASGADNTLLRMTLASEMPDAGCRMHGGLQPSIAPRSLVDGFPAGRRRAEMDLRQRWNLIAGKTGRW
jgi:hypothetical protein